MTNNTPTEAKAPEVTARKLRSGNYIVERDGRKIGFVVRQEHPWSRVGRKQFVAYTATQPRPLNLDEYLYTHHTLKAAVADIAEKMARS